MEQITKTGSKRKAWGLIHRMQMKIRQIQRIEDDLAGFHEKSDELSPKMVKDFLEALHSLEEKARILLESMGQRP